ncbi:hypothetical protein JV46_03630 [Solemya velum gill symbiont]|uniref:Uncharacterized protein n=1 Tax=Solemya velum gill symbiont TaxID=2340 RepID=A0A0B0HAX0_SOVGS|nr:hypothetical protein JV46_03630 [Solemya velum gill symbiont]
MPKQDNDGHGNDWQYKSIETGSRQISGIGGYQKMETE